MKKIAGLIIVMLVSLNSFSQIIELKRKDSGVYMINCKVNSMPMSFILDTGANDVTISKLEAKMLLKQGLLDTCDIIGTSLYMTASGQIDTAITFIIKELQIGDVILRDVSASIINSERAPLLLGINALEKLGILLVDLKKGTIEIKN